MPLAAPENDALPEASLDDGGEGSVAPSASEATRAALNAVLGDYLERVENPLAIQMGFYHRGAPLHLSPDRLGAAYPALGPRIVVLVHGMALTERSWCFPGAPNRDYGSLLAHDFGLTPFYVRYNTGRHVSQNGRELALLLERLIQASPVPILDITLIGHSMGGLVIRSACHYASESEMPWIRRARRAFYLGSPHLGSPYEKAGSLVAAALGAIDEPVVRLIHQIAETRSSGIKDLRHGSLLDEDWQSDLGGAARLRREVPLHGGLEHYFIAGALTRDAKHWASLLLGDSLVRLGSAMAPAQQPGSLANGAIIPGVLHPRLAHSPEVYACIRTWFAEPPRTPESAGVDSKPLASPAARENEQQVEGYLALVEDAIQRGATAIQEVQEELSRRPYQVLEQVPGLDAPARVVRALHFAGIDAAYSAVRAVNHAAGVALRYGIRSLQQKGPRSGRTR